MLYGMAAIFESYNREVAEAHGIFDTAILAPAHNNDTNGHGRPTQEVWSGQGVRCCW
jgi:hypothetical protein